MTYYADDNAVVHLDPLIASPGDNTTSTDSTILRSHSSVKKPKREKKPEKDLVHVSYSKIYAHTFVNTCIHT